MTRLKNYKKKSIFIVLGLNPVQILISFNKSIAPGFNPV